MERMTGNVPGPKNQPVPVTFNMDFVFYMDDVTYLRFMELVRRLYDYEETGLAPEEITALAAKLRQIEEGQA